MTDRRHVCTRSALAASEITELAGTQAALQSTTEDCSSRILVSEKSWQV